MRITDEFLSNLTPVEISFIQASITKLYRDKVKHETSNYENLNPMVERCPHCGSTHFVKNGFNPKNKQKYRCKDCHSVFMAVTKTMFSHSKTNFNTWSVFIAGELNGLTLRQQSVATELTVTTCFNMRHKLYKAASAIQKDVLLSGMIELDPSYTGINLKGTKPKNMPRYSKHRGHRSKSAYTKHIRGLSNHKVCILSAVDEHDNLLLKIAGLGEESIDKLEKFNHHFVPKSTIISDDKSCIKNFALTNGMTNDFIPSIALKPRFTTDNGNSISSVNELHTEVKGLIRRKRGISTRHLQGYLDWLVFRKHLKYTVEMKKWRPKAYMELMQELIPFACQDVCKLKMPISLFEAYGSYRYGIFRFIN